ncbi:MAG: hypothetical protein ACSHX7_09265 [Luteolibacter sp.]
MKYPLLTAFLGALTLLAGWLPLGLASFGSFIVIGAIMCFVPTLLIAVLVAAVSYTLRKNLRTLDTLKTFLFILTGLTTACAAPLLYYSIPISTTELVHPGYWLVAIFFLVCGSLATTVLAKQEKSEDGDTEEAV